MKLEKKDFVSKHQNLPIIGMAEEKKILQIVFTIIEQKVIPILFKIGKDMNRHETRINDLIQRVEKLERPGR